MKFQDKLEVMKVEIREAGYESFEVHDRYQSTTIGTLYLVKKMDYGFQVFFIHEPNRNTKAGVYGTVTEMFYDLRNRVYWIKRNGREVKFNSENVDAIFPQSDGEARELFDNLSTNGNQGMYMDAYKYLGKMEKERNRMFGRFFHRLITEHSYFELLYKAKIKVDSNLRIRNPHGRNPMEILGLNKTQWKLWNQYKEFGLNLERFSYSPDYSPEPTDKDRRAVDLFAYIRKLEEEYGIDKLREFIENEILTIYGGWGYRSAIKTAQDHHLPLNRFIRYIYFECDVSQGMNARTAVEQYADYIRMVKEMNFERFDKYPKFLKTVHDIVARNYNIKLTEEEKAQWAEKYEKNKEFTAKVGAYKIFPPENPEDLVREGNILGHCVGSYVKKVQKGSSIILFLREAEEEEQPLVTIEVRNSRITQARGKMNNVPTSDEQEAVAKFAKRFELKLETGWRERA